MKPILKLNQYRDKLHALRDHLFAQLSQRPDEGFDASDSADRASHQSDLAVNIGLATHEAALLKEIEAALGRIDAGTYAICEKCKAKIGARRLTALPYARYCVECERRVEQDGATAVGLVT